MKLHLDFDDPDDKDVILQDNYRCQKSVYRAHDGTQ